MCRLLAYTGVPIVVDQLVYQPRNSLIHQSYEAKELEEHSTVMVSELAGTCVSSIQRQQYSCRLRRPGVIAIFG